MRHLMIVALTTGAALGFAPGGRAQSPGDSLPFLFTYSATTGFHNTFVYDGKADSWQWHMDNDSAGVRRPFARLVLTRQ